MAAAKPIKNVIVIGAGIGGLSVSHALRRLGLSVKVLERAAFFSPHSGAGFGLSPNGQACLATLGLQDEVRKILHPFRFHEVRGDGGKVVVQSDHMETLLEKYGMGVCGTLRAQLVEILAKPLKADGALVYSSPVSAVTQEGDVVHVEVEGQGSMQADLVVGADGINSLVARDVMKVKDEPVYSGDSIFYGVIEAPDMSKPWPFKDPAMGRPETLLQVLDRGEFIAFPVGGAQGPDKPYTELVWALTHRTPTPPRREEWEGGGTRAELKKILEKKYPHDYVAHEALDATEDYRLMHFGMSYRKPVTTWHKGRVVLLGDACHATLPYVGQGANQAIEDAVVLAQCLKEEGLTNVEAALAKYKAKRFDRTKAVVDMAWYLGKLMHVENKLASLLRDQLLSALVTTGAFLKMAEEEIILKCPVPIKPLKA